MGKKSLPQWPTGLYQAVQQVCNWSQSKKREQDRRNISHNFSQIEVKPLFMDPGYLDSVFIPVKLKKKMNTTLRLTIVKLLKTKDKEKNRIALAVQWLRITCRCRVHGFDPWSGKIPHAEGTPKLLLHDQGSLCTPELCNEQPLEWGRTPQRESSLRSLQLEKAHTQQHPVRSKINKY